MINSINNLVSIIVPVYNAGDYLEKCINSIINQSYQNLEIIFVNDGSTDNSASILDKYSEVDDRIIVFHQENQGVSKSRNLALEKMKGDYLIFVDSDDLIHNRLVEVCIKEIIDNDVDLLIYPYKKFDSEKEISINCAINYKKCFYTQNELFYEFFKGKNGKQKFRGLCCNKMYKANYFKEISFPEGRKYGEDTFVTYKIFKKTRKALFLDECILYFYRNNLNSALNKKISIYNLQLFETYNYILNDVQKNYSKYIDLIVYAYCIRILDFIHLLKTQNNNDYDYVGLKKEISKVIKLSIKDVFICNELKVRMKINCLIFLIKYKL